MPQAKNIACTPRISARRPKKSGASVFAMLVESEFTLYAASYSVSPTDWAIIVLTIGTVPFVKKPRIRARSDMITADGLNARMMSAMKIQHSQPMKRYSSFTLSVSLPIITFPRRLPTKKTDVNTPMKAASIPLNVRRNGMKMKREAFANESRKLAAFDSPKAFFFSIE